MDSVIRKYLELSKLQVILFYLLVFFLPYLEVPFLEKIFVLKISNVLAILIGIIILYDFFINKKKIQLPFSSLFLIFILFSLLSTFNGFSLPLNDNLIRATGKQAPKIYSFVTLFWIIFMFFIFWITINVTKEKKILIDAIRIHLISAGIVSLFGILAVLGYKIGINTGLKFTELDWIVPRLSSTALEPIFFANYLLTVIPLGLIIYLTKNDILNERISLVLIFIQFAAFLMTFSIGAWGCLLIAILFIIFAYFKEMHSDRVLKITIPIAVFAVILFIFGLKTTLKSNLKTLLLSKLENTVKSSTYEQAKEYYQAEFLEYDKVNEINPGMYRSVNIKVKNSGTKVWKPKSLNPVDLTYFWLSEDKPVRKNIIRIRTVLPHDILPGESIRLTSFIRAPELEGKYTLKFDMAEEFVSLFEEQGRSLPLIQNVNVSGPFRYYGAAILGVKNLPKKIIQGTHNPVKVKLKNTGTIPWNHKGKSPVRLSYRWFNNDGIPFRIDGARASLPKNILPGESVVLQIDVVKPEYKDSIGYDTLKFDMIREYVVWFSEQDKTPMYHVKKYTTMPLNEYKPNVHTIVERWWLWRAGLNMFKEHPILGVGLGNFSFLYNKYKTADASYKTTFPVINNQYLEILVETGIPGMTIFLVFAFGIIKVYVRSYRRITDTCGKAIFIGLLACLLAVAIQLNLFCGKSLNYLWVILGLSIATSKLFMKDEKDAG